MTSAELRSIRNLMQMSQKELAERIGQSRAWVQTQETRELPVSAETTFRVRRLADETLAN